MGPDDLVVGAGVETVARRRVEVLGAVELQLVTGLDQRGLGRRPPAGQGGECGKDRGVPEGRSAMGGIGTAAHGVLKCCHGVWRRAWRHGTRPCSCPGIRFRPEHAGADAGEVMVGNSAIQAGVDLGVVAAEQALVELEAQPQVAALAGVLAAGQVAVAEAGPVVAARQPEVGGDQVADLGAGCVLADATRAPHAVEHPADIPALGQARSWPPPHLVPRWFLGGG